MHQGHCLLHQLCTKFKTFWAVMMGEQVFCTKRTTDPVLNISLQCSMHQPYVVILFSRVAEMIWISFCTKQKQFWGFKSAYANLRKTNKKAPFYWGSWDMLNQLLTSWLVTSIWRQSSLPCSNITVWTKMHTPEGVFLICRVTIYHSEGISKRKIFSRVALIASDWELLFPCSPVFSRVATGVKSVYALFKRSSNFHESFFVN